MSYKKTFLLALLFSFIFNEATIAQSFNYSIVFVSRNHRANGNIFFPSAGLLPGMGPFSRTSVVGGRLLKRDVSGTITVLIDSTLKIGKSSLIDVQQPCVHWSGTKILFSGIEHRDSSWRIYELNLNTGRINQITYTNRFIDLSQFGKAAYKFVKYDDIDPVYLPDGNIIFASTRYPTLSIFGGSQVTNLFITDSIGSYMHRITSERNGAEKPTIDPQTGMILYSRWWVNIDRPSNLTSNGITRVDSLALTNYIANFWQVNIINPDGDMLKQFATDARNSKSFFSYRPRVMPDGKLLSIYVPYLSMYHTSGSPGIRYYSPGFSEGRKIIGVDSTTPLYVQTPPSYGTMQPPYATDPVALPDGKIMFSYANSVIEQDYGIYTCMLDGTGVTPIFDIPGKLELNAELLIERTKPPEVLYLNAYDTNLVPPTSNPSTFYQGGLFRFDCINVYANAPVDAPVINAPPIKKNAKFRFFLNFQREDEHGEDYPILIREIALDRDGKIAEGDIPANVSMFEQIVDSNGNIVVNREGVFAHVPGFNFGNNGSGTKCAGCHAGHSLIHVPFNLTEGSFTNLSTSTDVRESSYRQSGSNLYKGINTTDRKARNTDLNVNWISTGSNNEYVVLKWEIPIDVRRFILYDIQPNTSSGTDIHVTDCEILMYYNNTVVNHIQSTGPLSTEGAVVAVNPITTIDSAKIIVKSFTGGITNQNVAGLAEIETNARVSSIDLMNVNEPITNAVDYKLYQNFPNPFNPSTLIRFSLPKAMNVRLEVFDITGKSVALLISGKIEGGINSIPFYAKNLSSGVYFYRITATPVSGSLKGFTETKRMLLIK